MKQKQQGKIQVTKEVREILKQMKLNNQDTYNNVLARLIKWETKQ
ncbi:hypothetical protein ES702_02306 [subsurface metagenome]